MPTESASNGRPHTYWHEPGGLSPAAELQVIHLVQKVTASKMPGELQGPLVRHHGFSLSLYNFLTTIISNDNFLLLSPTHYLTFNLHKNVSRHLSSCSVLPIYICTPQSWACHFLSFHCLYPSNCFHYCIYLNHLPTSMQRFVLFYLATPHHRPIYIQRSSHWQDGVCGETMESTDT